MLLPKTNTNVTTIISTAIPANSTVITTINIQIKMTTASKTCAANIIVATAITTPDSNNTNNSNTPLLLL